MIRQTHKWISFNSNLYQHFVFVWLTLNFNLINRFLRRFNKPDYKDLSVSMHLHALSSVHILIHSQNGMIRAKYTQNLSIICITAFSIDWMNCQSLCAVILLANAIQTNSNTDTGTGISYRIRTVDVYFAHAAQFKQFHSTIVSEHCVFNPWVYHILSTCVPLSPWLNWNMQWEHETMQPMSHHSSLTNVKLN